MMTEIEIVKSAHASLVRPPVVDDEGLHFSDLKKIGTSAAHFIHGRKQPRTMTGPMRLGMIVDRILTGGRVPPTYPGSSKGNMNRQGGEWKEWAADQVLKHGWKLDELATKDESDQADEIARAVSLDEVAMFYLTGRPQVALTWTSMGVKRVTRGIDVVGDGWISDLKITHSADPARLMRHAESMLWHAQLADYREACSQNKISTANGVYLVAIESSAPYVATVLDVTPAMLEEGDRCLHLWIEKFKMCAAANAWPGYAQLPVKWEPWSERMPQLTGFDGEDESE
jgi:hypothetical protein